MKKLHILLVEDNEGDIVLTTEALEEGGGIEAISVVKNGRDALDFVMQKNDYEQVLPPDLVLLDINLPLKSGFEVLGAIKAHEATKHIPVIMFSTSASQNDIKRAYQNHANCYITKPADVTQFLNIVKCLKHLWFDMISLSC